MVSLARDDVPRISVVLVTYRRVDLLTRTLESFLATTSYPRDRLEILLTDDGSPTRDQARMRELPCDRFLLSRRNHGLGHNTNKGLREASGELILQLQDDWECDGPSDFLEAAVEVFRERDDVHMVRYREMAEEPPFERHVTRGGRALRIYENGHYDRLGRFVYTDNPHIKRRSFHETLGFFLEGVPMTEMEIEFCRRVDGQNAIRSGFIEGYGVFRHIGESQTFNPSVRRRHLRESLEKFPPTRAAVRLYQYLKSRSLAGRGTRGGG